MLYHTINGRQLDEVPLTFSSANLGTPSRKVGDSLSQDLLSGIPVETIVVPYIYMYCPSFHSSAQTLLFLKYKFIYFNWRLITL